MYILLSDFRIVFSVLIDAFNNIIIRMSTLDKYYFNTIFKY